MFFNLPFILNYDCLGLTGLPAVSVHWTAQNVHSFCATDEIYRYEVAPHEDHLQGLRLLNVYGG
jgi:hypothetical protein